MKKGDGLLASKECAYLCQCSIMTIRKYMRNGIIPSTKISYGRYLIKEADAVMFQELYPVIRNRINLIKKYKELLKERNAISVST